MKMRHYAFALAAMAAGLAALPATAQETTESTTTVTTVKGQHHYVYYGDHDIYFAPESKTYYWQEGDAWQSGVELPENYRAYVKKDGVKIELDTERPYERNEWVVKHYKHHDRD